MGIEHPHHSLFVCIDCADAKHLFGFDRVCWNAEPLHVGKAQFPCCVLVPFGKEIQIHLRDIRI